MNGSKRGFALLEVLVALAIFAVISLIAYRGLDSVSRTRRQLSDANLRLREITLAVGLVERDLGQIAARPVRGSFAEALPALRGSSTAIELTHYAFASAIDPGRPSMERSSYTFADSALQRQTWGVLDRAPSSVAAPRLILHRLRNIALRYLSVDGRWYDAWPPPGPSGRDDQLPRAIDVRLELDDYGSLRRLIELPVAAAP